MGMLMHIHVMCNSNVIITRNRSSAVLNSYCCEFVKLISLKKCNGAGCVASEEIG